MTGLLGKKIGRTQVFAEDGKMVGVTAIEAGPCFVLAVKERSIQLGFDAAKESRVKKPILGYFKKINLAPLKLIREVLKESGRDYKVAEELKVDMFAAGDLVDVCAVSIGKGFQGGMKRWHWKGGPMTHGSTSHRRVGSIGSTTTPGRVWKGHHMPGHMGARKTTLQNLKVIKTDLENNIMLVEGTVPGHKDCYVIIRKAVKQRVKKAALTKSAAKEQGKK